MRTNNREVCLVTVCPFCGHVNEIEVNEMDYWYWDDGISVQEAFPYLSPEEREMLISGICPTCWEKTFADEPEEELEDYEEDTCEMGFNPYEGGYDYDC